MIRRIFEDGVCFFFFFNDTATTEIYTLSLHDALPICRRELARLVRGGDHLAHHPGHLDRKSTRLNSSHTVISYAVFCLKKKKTQYINNSIDKKSHQNKKPMQKKHKK